MTVAEQLTAALAGRYEILREAGSGGMATVYLARDLKHDRQVAIKVLKADLAATLGPERFLQEVRIAAKLQHPHILPVFDSGDANGTLWYAMPFVEGESLRDRLRTGTPIPFGEVIRTIREVASALAKAHEAGIVHRDIKPENILLSGGHALVADFGIAKAVTSAASASSRGLTSAGMSLGTPGYMAPEQVAADPAADHRVDIYSLGIVAWELVVGKAPFADLPPAQQLAAHVTTVPDPVRTRRKDCPPALEDAIAKCIAKPPEQRFQKASELVAWLDKASEPSGAHPPVAVPSRRWTPARIVGTAAGVAAIVTALYLSFRDFRPSGAASQGPSLAVLPFENLQGDSATAYFSDGITEEIIGSVSRVPGLHVASRSVSFRHRGRDLDVKKVGREIGVTHLLEGSVQRAGNRVRVNVRLTDVRSGFSAWTERYDRELTDIFAVEDEIATKVATALDVQLVARAAASGSTKNMAAHDAYLLGLKARNDRSLKASAEQFSKAIALDSNYASAHGALASVLVLFPEYGLVSRPDSAISAARTAARKALALDSAQAVAHLALGYAAKVYGRDFAGAGESYRRALTLDPNSAEGHHWFGELLMEQRKFEEARAEFRASVARDSLAPASVAMLAMSMFRIGKVKDIRPVVDSAQEICRHVTEISPPGGVFPFEFGCGTALTHAKRYDAAREHLARAGRAMGDTALFTTLLDGVRDPAQKSRAISRLQSLTAGSSKLDPVIAAFWYMHLGEHDKAIANLERAESSGSPYGAFLEVLDFSALPSDPRLTAVRTKLGY